MRGDTASPAAHIPGAGSPSAYVYMVQLPCLDVEELSPTLTSDPREGEPWRRPTGVRFTQVVVLFAIV